MAGFDLGKQVGPLPLGAWIGVVAGGLGIGWYFSKGSAKAGGDAPLVPVAEPGVGTGGGQLIYDPPTSVPSPDNSKITTNAEWSQKAQNFLFSRGFDPSAALAAVTKFLTGQNRTSQEEFMISQALLSLGPPPEEIPLPQTPAPQPKPPTPAPVRKYQYYSVAKGDTIGSIATKFKTSWWNIYVTNDKIGLRPDGSKGIMSGPWDTKPGMLLVIPTVESGGLRPPPAAKPGPIRYYTVRRTGETITTVAKIYNVHPAKVFEANDIAGLRQDGSRGFLVNPSQSLKTGQKLIIPYQ